MLRPKRIEADGMSAEECEVVSNLERIYGAYYYSASLILG